MVWRRSCSSVPRLQHCLGESDEYPLNVGGQAWPQRDQAGQSLVRLKDRFAAFAYPFEAASGPAESGFDRGDRGLAEVAPSAVLYVVDQRS